MIPRESTTWHKHLIAWFQNGCDCDELASIPQMPDQLAPGCTVVICTYKRARSLARFLDSLREQTRLPDQLVIVDASPNNETEISLQARDDIGDLAHRVLYARVTGPLKGLTRQRNLALRWVMTDRVAFFDDDVVLDPACLGAMERAHADSHVVGVGASTNSEPWQLNLRWRMRLLLRMVPRLAPGRYWRSGMGTPWAIAQPTEAILEGDFLPGCGMMWKTVPARQIGFCEEFDGYAQGEDLDFSLRMRSKGKLVMAGRARLKHMHDPNGRPNAYYKGSMEIYNHFCIYRRAFPGQTGLAVVWFAYAWALDTLFLTHNLLHPLRCWHYCKHIAGRLKGAWDILRRHRPQLPSCRTKILESSHH